MIIKRSPFLIYLCIAISAFYACHNQNNNGFNRVSNVDPTRNLPFRPNIVWLVAEDLSPILPAFGDSTVSTPAIDRLAHEGIRYTNAFSTSGVCAPSRCTLVTGMYPASIGGHNMRVQYSTNHLKAVGLEVYEIVPPPEVKMLSQLLREKGYFCSNNEKEDHQFAPTVTAWDEKGPKAHWRHRQANQPFFSVFNFEVTHEGRVSQPFTGKMMRYNDPYFPDSLDEKRKPVIMGPDGAWELNVPGTLEVPIPPYLPATEKAVSDIRRVYSNVVELDRQISIILEQLEDDGLLDSTVVFIYADHGGPLPRQKRLIYDSGIKVPLIIRFPQSDAGAGTYNDRMVSFVDFAPTVLSIAGIQIPAYMQGEPFLGKSGTMRSRKYVYAAADRFDDQYDMIRAVRDNRYKYLRNFNQDQPYYLPIKYRESMAIMQELLRLNQEGELNEIQSQWFRDTKSPEELFDTWNDPHELNNLADDPEYEKKLVELRNECNRWMNEINDLGHIPEREIREKFWPDGKQPLTLKPRYTIEKGMLKLTSNTDGAHIGFRKVKTGQYMREDNWDPYTKPIRIMEGETVFAVAHRLGYTPSGILEITLQ